jgi:hypothetical protein
MIQEAYNHCEALKDVSMSHLGKRTHFLHNGRNKMRLQRGQESDVSGRRLALQSDFLPCDWDNKRGRKSDILSIARNCEFLFCFLGFPKCDFL